MGIVSLFTRAKDLESVGQEVIVVDLSSDFSEEPFKEEEKSSEFDFDNCHVEDGSLDYGALDQPLESTPRAAARRRRPKYGPRGSVGPAPRFTWAETTCSDGTLLPYKYRTNAVRIAKTINNLRIKIAKKFNVPVSNVYVSVNSWYRSPAWNKAVGGEPNSQHLLGNAMDINIYIKVKNIKKHKLKRVKPKVVQRIANSMPWADHCGLGSYDDFTHLDTRGYRARW